MLWITCFYPPFSSYVETIISLSFGTLMIRLLSLLEIASLFPCHVKTPPKDNHLKIRKWVLLTRTQPCWYSDLRLPIPRTVRNQFKLSKPLSLQYSVGAGHADLDKPFSLPPILPVVATTLSSMDYCISLLIDLSASVLIYNFFSTRYLEKVFLTEN